MQIVHPQYELFKPLVQGWLGKIESAYRSRSKWSEVSEECMMFYNKSAAAMWDPTYTKKFWSGVAAPKFRITMNKAFELVAIFGPNLMWEVPNRRVAPVKSLNIPPELYQNDPMMQQMMQQLGPQQDIEDNENKIISQLMERWLNYTPREQPGGGLAGHSELAITDALIKGRGVMCIRPYKMPGSGRTLTGSFREHPENLLIDPDFNTLHEARWIAIRHVDPHWSVERRFKQPDGSLKSRGSLESSWHHGELQGSEGRGGPDRVAGKTNDLIVWYEIYSKTGPGARLTGMQSTIKDHLEKTVGDYAYIAVCPNVPYPLNCTTENLHSGLSSEQVKERFSWPIPLWADDRWPVEVLDFYPDIESAWPTPPLAPALGELKFLNFLVPWLANRVYTSSRDFWAVAGPHVEHYTKYLQSGLDQTVIPTPAMVDDVRKAITVLQQPETRMDAWRIIELVSELFDKRTGLTEFNYGRNEQGTQNRTAEETRAKARAVGVRPEHMQQQVIGWQSRIAGVEGFLARWFVQGDDVAPLMGPIGKQLWERYIMSTQVERTSRQMDYTIAASSIRRPDRDRDIGRFNEFLQTFIPVIQHSSAQSGNYEPVNALMRKWGELHDMDLEGAEVPPPPPPEPDPAAQQQQQMEMAKIQAELQGKQLDIKGKQIDIQGKQMLSELQVGQQQQKIQMDSAQQQQKIQLDSVQQQQQLQSDGEKQAQQLEFDGEKNSQDMWQDSTKHLLDMLQDRQKFNQELEQSEEMAEVKLDQAKAISSNVKEKEDRSEDDT